MIYRRLGKTGLKVSVVGAGTWQFGGEWGRPFAQPEADAILHRAEALGINLVDTAECYGDGTSERLVGAALAGRREKWVIATKFGHHYNSLFERSNHWTPAEVLGQLETSLKNLRTDRIDLYQFHSGGDDVFDNDALWTALGKAVRDGKIRHLGVSIGSNDNLHQTEAATKVGAAAIQVVYNRLDRKPEGRVFPACLTQDLGVLARVPLASGFLAGKYTAADAGSFPADDVRGKWWKKEDIVAAIAQVEEIRKSEVPAGVEMAGWALAWCLRHPAVTCVIPGLKSPAQAESNAAAGALAPQDHPQALPA